MSAAASSGSARRPLSRRSAAAALVALGLLASAYLAWRLLIPDPTPEEIWRQLAGDRPLADLNVILITVDTLRADHLGCYGHPEIATPHFDALAREGVRFANVATTVPFTLPAHSSIMTGTYPPYHGVRENVGYALNDRIPTLAEGLAAAGRATAGFVSAFVLDGRWGIARGFDHYFDDFDVASMKQINLGSVQRDGRETIAEAVRWLDEDRAGPFFLWLHLFDPHEPYKPPEPFRSRYPQHPYAAEVAYTDSLIGEFRQALEQRGLLESSLLALTGDHGEGLGHHRESFHGFFIYDSTLHVPLILRAPFGDLGGRVVDQAVSHVDLLPTLLAAVGAPVPSPETVQGESLLPLMLEMEDGSVDEERAVYSESYYSLFHYGWAPLRSLRTGTYKYIDAPEPELYQLAEDPAEERNLFRDKRRTARGLELRLDALMASFDRPEQDRERPPDLDQETLEQLRALGYVAGRGEVAEDDDEDGEARTARADPKGKIEVHQSIMWAQTFIGQGNDEEAEKRLEKALEQDPGMIDAFQMLGNIAHKRRRFEEAAERFQQALALDSNHRASLFGLATAYRRLGRLPEALVGFRRLQSLAPHDSKAAVAMTEIHVELGEIDAALAAVADAARAPGAPALVHNQHGELLAMAGRPGEAADELERAISLDPRLAQPRFNLAVLHEERGEIELAVERYAQALARAPRHFQAQFNLGRLYGAQGDLDRQQELWEAAIESYPDFVRGYYYLAKLLMDRAATGRAATGRAATGRAATGRAATGRGAASGRSDDFERAEDLARQGLARDPEGRAGPLGYFVLADLLNRSGRHAEALRAVDEGRRLAEAAP